MFSYGRLRSGRDSARDFASRNGTTYISHVSVLERLNTAVAIFAQKDTRLIFHNSSFARLWKLDASWLMTSSPDYAEVLEQQRSNRLLPEVADYPAFRERELSRFQSLIDPLEESLALS